MRAARSARSPRGILSALLDGLKALGAARLGALAAVAIGMFGLLAVLAMHGGTDHMALLYADLDLREAGQMGEALDRAHIPHQINSTGTELLVPQDQVSRARLLLAHDGLPSGGSIGYEIFDRGDSLTASQFQQSINQTRALEGELSRTIRTINGVRAARVHLVLSHREPFERARQEAQASVMLTLAGANRLDREGIQAVVNLVAAAVPSLRPKNIAIIDSRGNLLARAGEATDATEAAQSGEEMRHATELRLARAVEQMLERTLGPGRVRAEAAVEMNFEQIHETQERFDPDGQVVRSTQSTSDNSKSTEANPSVSVQNNLPNADAGGNGTGSQEQKQDETTNYEIGKTVRTLVREQPQIQKISLAVLVDGTETKAPDGTLTWKERSPDELARLGTLVRGAIGFDEKRGDHVEVVTMRFADEAGEASAEPRGLLGIPIEKADVMKLAQTALIGVVGLVGLLLVLRPMVLRLTANPAGASAILAGSSGTAAVLAGLSPGGMLADGSADTAGDGGAAGVPRIAGPGGSSMIPAPNGGDSMITMSNVEGQLRLSSVRKVVDLVQRHPEESLSIVRAWMQQESAE